MREKQAIYLAGPITGLTYSETTTWRNDVGKRLEESGKYTCLSPMRGKQSKPYKSDIFESCGYYDGCFVTPSSIFSRDRYDVLRADALFVNLLGAKRVSIFTMMEMAWAFDHNKFVLVVMENDKNIHNHFCVEFTSSVIVPSIDLGVEYFLTHLN